MAQKEIILTTCDKCGTESGDEFQFRHVTVSKIDPAASDKPKEMDLCLSCLGAPGVNV